MRRGGAPIMPDMVKRKFVQPVVSKFSSAPPVTVEQPVAPTIRKDFPESWIWENILDSELVFEKNHHLFQHVTSLVYLVSALVFIITKKVHLVYAML
jgi:hypothetical protein